MAEDNPVGKQKVPQRPNPVLFQTDRSFAMGDGCLDAGASPRPVVRLIFALFWHLAYWLELTPVFCHFSSNVIYRVDKLDNLQERYLKGFLDQAKFSNIKFKIGL